MSVIVGTLLLLVSWQDALPTVEQIEERVLAQRRAIKSGQVELTSTIWATRGGTEEVIRGTTNIWFDGKKIRGDRIRPYKDVPSGADASSYREVSCFAGEEHIFYTNVVPPGGGAVAVGLTDRAQKEKNSLWKVVDPRVIGLVPAASTELTKYHDEYVLRRTDRHPPEVRRDVQDGLPCYRVTYRRNDDLVYKYCVVPDRGFSIAEMEVENAKGTLLNRLQCEFHLHEKSGIWFVKSAKVQHFPSSSRGIGYREELAVKVLQLNEPVPDVVFTLKGMDIPKGRHVSDHRKQTVGVLVWDGNEVVPAERRVEVPKRSADSNSNRLDWFVAASAVLAVLASVAIWKGTRPKAPNRTRAS